MISLDNLDDEMKKVSDYLKNKHINANSSWLKDKMNLHKNKNKIEEIIYKEAILSDIKDFIDKDKLKKFPSNDEKLKFENGTIFLQINGYLNIAESKESQDKKKEENLLDVLDNFESKFLQAEGEEVKRVERTVLKFEFTDGYSIVHGFEYEDLKEFRQAMISTLAGNKFLKVIVGPTYEMRRGIIYLKKDNIKLL
jgi:hypothetical protein